MSFLDDDDLVDKKAMKEEALARMAKHKLLGKCIMDYNTLDIVMCSENGIVRKLNEKENKIVQDYEKTSGCLVYHIIHSFSNIGETYELLRVSNYMDDWTYENSNLEKGIILVYAQNMTHPDWSESGSIEVENYKGALFRIG